MTDELCPDKRDILSGENGFHNNTSRSTPQLAINFARSLYTKPLHALTVLLPYSNEDSEKLVALKESVPSEVPGIAFLSGGQTEIEATENLNLINKNNNTNFIMTYSYGRALQQSALKFWSKDINNIKETQNIFNHRANMCSLAAQGKWSKELEN